MIKRINIEDIPKVTGRHDNLQAQIKEFYTSDWEACEVDARGYKTAKSCYQAWSKAAKRSGYGLRVMYRNDRVFVLRRDQA